MAKSVAATLKDILAREEKLLASIKKTVSLVAQKQSKAALKEITAMKANAIKKYKELIKTDAPAPAKKKAATKKKTAAKKKAAPKKKAPAKKKAAPKKAAAKKAAPKK